jgi:dTDP-4-dehydrorhamnose reductase
MRVAIVTANGQVGRALVEQFADLAPIQISRPALDLRERASIERAIAEARPDMVLLPAALTDVDACERDPATAFAVNALGPRWIAQAADKVGAGVLYVSSDYVFAGDGGAPYDEWTETRPLSVYGRSKLAGEHETRTHASRAWIVRTSWVYGGEGRSFVNTMVRALETRPSVVGVSDEVGGPTYAPDLAAAIRALLERDAPGTYHLANSGECSRLTWVQAIAEMIGSATPIEPITRESWRAKYPDQAARPAHSTLANHAAAALGVTLRPWRDALTEHLCASR